ncbi:MAG: hypothetical protein WCS87_20105 [Methylococcaceae bacterium]
MANSFVRGVLSTKRKRQNFFNIRMLVTFACAGAAYNFFGGTVGVVAGFVAIFISYMTVAPIVAFTLCLLEWLLQMG